MKLKDLPVGAIISDPRWKMYDEVIKFRKVADGHYTSDDTVLITDKIIKYMCVDAKEPNNSNSNRQKYGNNRYIHSNVRQWLNSTETNWYSDQHSADQAPDKDNVSYGDNPYDNIPGFLNNCPDDFIKAILNTNLEVVKSTTDGGGKESFTDKVFLPSRPEIGLGQENSLDDGKPIPYFNSNDRRKAVPTESAKKNNDDSSDYARYWLRTPSADYSDYVRCVDSDGSLYHNDACNGYRGVRPALRLDGSTLVESQGDEYVLKFNTPPVISGKDEDLGEVSKEFDYNYNVFDADGDKLNIVERLNNKVIATHNDVESGSEFTINITKEMLYALPLGKRNTLQIEVRDDKGATTFREIYFVRDNSAPIIQTDVESELGEITQAPTINVTVTDPEKDAVSLKVLINKKTLTELEDIELGKATEISIDKQTWAQLELGRHSITIIATDAEGGASKETIFFTRAEDRIKIYLKKAEETDAILEGILPLLFVDEAEGFTEKVLVTNNAFDDNPVWEDCTKEALNSEIYVFKNKESVNNPAFQMRVEVEEVK